MGPGFESLEVHQLGMDFAPFKKPQASAWGFPYTAALFLAFPVKFCFATFHGGPQSTAYPDLRVFLFGLHSGREQAVPAAAGKKQSSGLFLRPRVPRLGACYRGPSICVVPFHGSPSGGFLFMLLFFFEYVPVHFPLRGGLICRGVAADDISLAAIFLF